MIRIHPINEHSPYYESPREIADGLAWGARKRYLLDWVDRQMDVIITAIERECIRLHYYCDKPFRDISVILHRNPSSIWRAVQRGIAKLRIMAELEGLTL